MMQEINFTIPLYAAMRLPDDRWRQLSERFLKAGGGVTRLAASEQTGAFLRGLARTHNIPDDKMPKLALGVLYVALGEWPLAKLASGLSSTMGLPNDVAQKAAAEIEKELFAPIMLEFNKFLEEQRRGGPASGAAARQAGATNVIDLKKHNFQNTEHKQFPKPKFQTKKGPDLPKPGQFNR